MNLWSFVYIYIFFLQFLDHQLNAHNRQAGIIFPSLPIKPATDPAGAESRSKKQLGSKYENYLLWITIEYFIF